MLSGPHRDFDGEPWNGLRPRSLPAHHDHCGEPLVDKV
jgi:hypothetical protein